MNDLPEINILETSFNIRRLMRKNHLDNFDLMMKLHYSSPTNIYSWKNGTNVPNIDNLVKLAYIFDCKIEDILVVEYPEGARK